MSMTPSLLQRCNKQCELCSASIESPNQALIYALPYSEGYSDSEIALCQTCTSELAKNDGFNINHWRCLNDSMWSPTPAVQVCAWRMLKKLDSEDWARDLLDMLYLDEELSTWAQASSAEEDDDTPPTKDSNGAILQAGDSVVIIKDLDVKGTSFVAKRGTAVRNIALTNNPEHIEGRVNGTRIVILTQFVKKS